MTILYFDGKQLVDVLRKAGVDVRSSRVIADMRIELEDWLKNVIEVSDKEGFSSNLSDVSVLESVKVNSGDNISVPVIARVGRQALSRKDFFCSLSRTNALKNCSQKHGYPPYTSKKFSFTYFLCPTLNSLGKSECSDAPAPTRGNPKGRHKRFIYLLASLGAALVFFVLFARHAYRSRKFNLQQALRKREQYDHVRLPEEDDEHYFDVMFHHHRSTNAEINPLYGFDEQEDESAMVANPLYGTKRSVESPQVGHARSFENPLFGTLERQPGLRAKPVGKEAN